MCCARVICGGSRERSEVTTSRVTTRRVRSARVDGTRRGDRQRMWGKSNR